MVRKLVVTAAALGLGLGLSTTASAQSVVVGGELGLNVANVSAEAEVFGVNTDSKTGFWGGLFAEFAVAKMFAVRPEVLYTNKGFKVSDDTGELKVSTNYIQIPLLLEAVIPIEGSPVRPALYAGPAVGFETSCNFSASAGGVSGSTSCDDAGLEPRASTVWSLIFGGQVGAMVGKVIPFVGIRYDLGLTNLDTSDDPDSVKGRTWTFYVGAGVPVK